MKRRSQTREKKENEDRKRERRDRKDRENEESEGEDRLSDFPDFILLHILSFLKIKQAVQTCILSTRWKNLWKHLPTLELYSSQFRTLKGFTKFVTRILSNRDSSSALTALTFQRDGSLEPNLLKRIVRYALSHNVDRLSLSCQINHIQPSLFSSHTLKFLNLQVYRKKYSYDIVAVFPNNLNLPALTGLRLRLLAFCADENGRADPFSGFNRLNRLTIELCLVRDGETLCISNTALIYLDLDPFDRNVDGDSRNPKIDLYAPKLSTFCFHGNPFRNLYGSNLSSLKHLDIDFYLGGDNHLILLNWLIELAHIKSLTVSLRTLQVLFSGPHKLKVKLPSLCNLKTLKVELNLYLDSRVMHEMVDLLLQNAPLAEACIKNRLSWTQTHCYEACIICNLDSSASADLQMSMDGEGCVYLGASIVSSCYLVMLPSFSLLKQQSCNMNLVCNFIDGL